MYYPVIGLLATMILLIENYDILLNRNATFQMPSWKVYRNFLFAVLFYYLTDITWGLFEYLKMADLLYVDTILYFFAMASGVYFWAQYTVTYLNDKTTFGRVLVFLGRTVAGLILLANLVNIFVPIVFTIDENCVYHNLILRDVMLVVQIVLLITISVHACSAIGKQPEGKKSRYRTITLFGLIMALFLTIQYWNAYLPLYSCAYMLGTCLLHSFVINNERDEYHQMKKMVTDLKKEILDINDTWSKKY